MIVETSLTETRRLVRAARARGLVVGCVPTMGALHPGHVSLIERASNECGFVVATIFVNPTQFGPNEDFTRYPRTLEADLELCRTAGADVVFTPQTSDMYRPEADTVVRVTQLATVLEGAHRPGHFDGVATIVAKLFQITEPDRAYFGQKDFQQLMIIQKMVSDLDMPIDVISCPIVRESDGLAMSSRNRYLSSSERRTAAHIYQSLLLAERLAQTTQLTPPEISERMALCLEEAGGIDVQYAFIAAAATLRPLLSRGPQAVALVAANCSP